MMGNFYVFEGPDGVGKSTLAKKFKEHLEKDGKKSLLLGFPGNVPGTLGKLVYDLHHDPENFNVKLLNNTSLQLMHIAAHIDAITNMIIPNLQEGFDIILDRFWWSTWVYGITFGVPKLAIEKMIAIEKLFWETKSPDILFLIDRSASLREDNNPTEWSRLRENYLKLYGFEKEHSNIEIILNETTIQDATEKIIIKYENLQKVSIIGKQNTEHLSFLEKKEIRDKRSIYFYSPLDPVKPTEVYNSYWFFATERQNVFFRKMNNETEPWTSDPIISTYKFTNAYRASDRVSQYLIKNVIYNNDIEDTNDIFFRILLFKFFNKIETWELLEEKLGIVTHKNYNFSQYDLILSDAISKRTIFSSAYIMPSGTRVFGEAKKHRNLLRLLEIMMADKVPYKIAGSKTMHEAFNIIKSYPMMGDFLAYQYVIDLNYSTLTNFSESEFVVPGPGAKDGIKKCFSNYGGLNEVDIIKLVRERQEMEFEKRGLEFKSLWGRPLQLIDCQNLFCETDKYARVAHPKVQGYSKRTRIKQKYSPDRKKITYWYPPKWGINDLIQGGNYDQGLRRENC